MALQCQDSRVNSRKSRVAQTRPGSNRINLVARRSVPWGTIAIGSGALAAIGVVVLANRSTAPVAPPKRIALVGDSYAVGLGPELAKLLSGFKFSGVVGTNTSQWANHSTACGTCGDWITAYKPDIVLVSLGVNDGSAPNPANYQTIVRGLHGVGARVVWIEPPAGVSAPAVRSVIESLGVQTVPATTTPLSGDGLHPRSYGEWAREVTKAIS